MASDPGHLLRDQRGDQLRRQMPRPFQQQAEQPLAESLRPVLPDLLAHAPARRFRPAAPW
ncbi:hypothetical protein [Streptomyces canus]|uniref:hypothetical protein n=1 Tax=Streptomyces canus TaxID=58343 RepID=UPI00225AEABB|nr:hypothetical protein [Streptomyces canus]MCX4853599.1 hypothetical protein [Streptomyces canus]